jgi:HAD superfamily hydrolase (TIGR01549 family)
VVRETKIKAVLFDLGETLLNFGRVNTGRLFAAGAKLSYSFLKSCHQPVGSFRPYCWRNLTAIRIRYWLSNFTKKDFDALALLKKLNSKKGIKLSEQQWQQLAWLWYEPLSKAAYVEPKITETLAALTQMGLKLGIVSNTFINASSLEQHLQQLGILDFFPVRIYSYEFKFRKPDSRIFRAAAERIGELLENILFVGDRIDTDIKPAAKAGMQAVLKAAYTNEGKNPPEGIRKITMLSELPALIRKINGESAEGCQPIGAGSPKKRSFANGEK